MNLGDSTRLCRPQPCACVQTCLTLCMLSSRLSADPGSHASEVSDSFQLANGLRPCLPDPPADTWGATHHGLHGPLLHLQCARASFVFQLLKGSSALTVLPPHFSPLVHTCTRWPRRLSTPRLRRVVLPAGHHSLGWRQTSAPTASAPRGTGQACRCCWLNYHVSR